MRAERSVPQLAEMVEGEIIPRLLLAHGAGAVATLDPEDAFGSPRTVVRLALSRDLDAFTNYVGRLVKHSMSVDAVYANLLAPAARLLADLWDQDQLSYTEVTIGLGRLQQLVRGMDWSTPYNGDNDPGSRSALFAPRPGEQQTFGFYIVEELFRWEGWRSWIETSTTTEELAANANCRWFDLFCLSASQAADAEDLATTIKAVRRASRNRNLFVLVSGRPFLDRPDLIAAVGADAAASCGSEALHVADKAVRRVANG